MKKRLPFFWILIAICIVALFPVTAAAQEVKLSDDQTVEVYDWRESWDANQNNAYIDIMTGIFNGQDEISVRSDYVTSLQLMNVVKRVTRELSVCEGIYFDSVSYTADGYADKINMSYSIFLSPEEIKADFREVADYTAFGKSYIDDTMTDLEKALFLHDFIGQNTFYKFYTSPQGMATGVLHDHIGTCENISCAYNELLYWADIPFGKANGSGTTVGSGHAWTVIYIDGKWYISDATFDSFTDVSKLKYTPPRHGYFLCGKARHLENNLDISFNTADTNGYKIENVEYDDPTAYWTLSDCSSNVAYHVNEGEPHGKLYYLSPGSDYYHNILTVRDSMSSDAQVTQYQDNIYTNIVWANDTLYGYRDNSIYVIDWNTHEETRIGYLEGNTYYNAANEAGQELDKEASGITGIAAENGKLSAQVTFTDGSTCELTADTYDRIEAFNADDWVKTAVSGPSQQPGEIFYDFSLNKHNFIDTKLSIKGTDDSFAHTDGYQFPDYVSGLRLETISDGAFKDYGPDKLAGELKFNAFIGKIGEHAFENCTGLSGCLDLTDRYDLGPYSFRGCTGIDKVILHPGRDVPEYAFAGCSGITEIVNLEAANWIYQSAFEGCTSLSGCLDFYEGGCIRENAFKDCVNIEIAPVLKSAYIESSAFENCSKITGVISIPNCHTLGDHPFANTGITGLTDTDLVSRNGKNLLYGTQVRGILSFPSLVDIKSYAFHDPANITALRFPNPDTNECNGNIYTFPESTDVALFIARGAPIEQLISTKWTYGVNYWYVDDVLASGELENGVVWSIGGDGIMNIDTADGVTETVTISGYSDTAAPWDEYKKYVDHIIVKSDHISFGSGAICDFANLRKAEIASGSIYDENSFTGCDMLTAENIISVGCFHTYGEWTIAQEPTCSREGTEERACTKCGEKETRAVNPLGHDWGEWIIVTEPTEEQDGLKRRFCNRGDGFLEETIIPRLPHTHNILHVEAADPTCTADGNIEYWTCSKCGKFYSDEECTIEISQPDTVIEATGHTFAAEFTVDAEPTCTTAGSKSKHCENCDVKLEVTAIPALTHDWGEWTVTTPATCKQAGEEQRICKRDPEHVETRPIEKLAHTEEVIPAVEPTCTETGLTEGKKCSVCGEILVAQEEVPAKGHEYKAEPETAIAATCTSAGKEADQKCSRCNDVIEGAAIPALDHDWDNGTITTQPTCTEEGLKTFHCSRCEETKTESVAALNHDLTKTAAVAPTCTTEGNIEYWTCSRCHKLFSDKDGEHEITAAETVVSKIAHTEEVIPAVAATCTETGLTAGKKCSVCGEILVAQEEVPALNHDWDNGTITTQPTCTEEGLKTFHCSRCEDTKTEAVKANGHTFDQEFTTDLEPTCTREGSKSRHCAYCDAKTEITPIPVKDHSFGDWVEIEASTCEGAGVEQHTCGECGFTETRNLNPNGHAWDQELTVDVEPTCTTDGSKSRHCANCDAVIDSEVIPSPGHAYGDWIVTEPTCTKAGSKVKTCGVCGDKVTEEIPAVPHHADGPGTVTKAPTAAAEGTMTYVCSECGNEFTQSIPLLTEEQAAANTAVEATSTSVEQAQSAADGVNETSSDAAIADVEEKTSEAITDAASAVENAQAAYDSAVEEYGAGSPAAEYAQSVLTEAKKQKAAALLASASVKETKAKSATSKATAAADSAAEAAATPGDAAISAAEEAEAAAREAATAAAEANATANAAFDAVKAAGYSSDSQQYKAAEQAVNDTATAKALADSALTAASQSVTAAKDAKTKADEDAAAQAKAAAEAAAKAQAEAAAAKKKVEEEAKESQPAEIVDLPAVKISKPKAAKKAVTVKWKKVSKKNQKKIQGIEIQVSTDKAFTNIVKSTTAGKKKTSKKIKGLQSKTKYWVRIRAYKNASDGKHVSAWKTKSFKAK